MVFTYHMEQLWYQDLHPILQGSPILAPFLKVLLYLNLIMQICMLTSLPTSCTPFHQFTFIENSK